MDEDVNRTGKEGMVTGHKLRLTDEQTAVGLTNAWSRQLAWNDVEQIHHAHQNDPNGLLSRVAMMGGLTPTVMQYFISKGGNPKEVIEDISQHILMFGSVEVQRIITDHLIKGMNAFVEQWKSHPRSLTFSMELEDGHPLVEIARPYIEQYGEEEE